MTDPAAPAALASGWLVERILSEASLQPIIALDRAAFTRPWSAAAFVRAVRDSDDCYLYTLRRSDDAELGGFCCFWIRADELHVATMAVRAEDRRRGVGALLMQLMLDLGRSHGAERITLEVRMSNLVARRLYERFGLRPVGARVRYYSKPVEDALVYQRAIEREESS